MDRVRRISETEDGYSREYDWAETLPSAAVVDVVATATGNAPTDLEPLYGSIDPDALDGLLAVDDESTVLGSTVSFTYAGFHLVVECDGTVRASPLD